MCSRLYYYTVDSSPTSDVTVPINHSSSFIKTEVMLRAPPRGNKTNRELHLLYQNLKTIVLYPFKKQQLTSYLYVLYINFNSFLK